MIRAKANYTKVFLSVVVDVVNIIVVVLISSQIGLLYVYLEGGATLRPPWE